MPLTPALVARTLVLKGVAGTMVGYLYCREGLEAAMIAHGTAAMVLHAAGSEWRLLVGANTPATRACRAGGYALSSVSRSAAAAWSAC